MVRLLARLDAPDGPPSARDLPGVQGMRRVLERHFVFEHGQVQWRSNKELERQAPKLESPYEPEARYSVQRGQEWTGDTVHLTETCDDDQPHLITNVETTTAEVHDAVLAPVVHQHLARRDLLPAQHWMDSGYVSAELLVTAKEQHGVKVIGPPRSPDNLARTAVGRYRLRDVEIDWDQQRVRCPNKQWSVVWQPTRRTNGQAIVIVWFAAATCSACPLRSQCTRAKKGPKSLTFQPQAQQQALEAARDFMNSSQGQRLYQRRMGIEATVSQGVRAFGMRQARYRGLANTHLHHGLTATAMDVSRLDAWLQGHRPARTRVSAFAALRAA